MKKQPQSKSNLFDYHSRTLTFEGQTFRVERLCELHDHKVFQCLLYSESGSFYIGFERAKIDRKEAEEAVGRMNGTGEVVMPRDYHKIRGIMKTSQILEKVSPRGALHWYCTQIVNEPLDAMLLDAISFFVPECERAGKEMVSAWVEPSRCSALKACAAQSGIEPAEQLSLFIDEGLERAKRPKAKRAKRKPAQGPFARQLELATALVEVVQKLDTAPAPETLAEARREASSLHSSLHSDEAFTRASVA